MSGYPVPDREAAKVLGAALRRVGYTESAVTGLLGDGAYSGERDDRPADERRLPQTRLATVIRAFFLQLTVPAGDAVRALGPRGVEALEATALAEVSDEIVPRARILPIDGLLLAADGYSRELEDPPDYVAGYTPTSRLCDSLTPRPRVGRALDVGTGSGAHALLAAAHAQHVVATDVNERALAYTELNAALNGLTNVECRRGSLLEPVEGESFDLITCNAPYVVSPERRWTYRDTGHPADELSERVVHEAARHLTDGGFAALLVSWVAADEDEPDERVLGWAEATGCDSWILPIWEADPLEHAAAWNADLAGDPEQFAAALEDWTEYFAALGVRWVSEGAVLLHRRRGRRHTTRVDQVDEDELEEAGEQIQRAFATRARLSGLRRRDELLDARIAAAAPLRLERELEPGRSRPVVTGSVVRLDGGTRASVETTAAVLEVVASLDGRTPLRELVAATSDRLGLSDAETSKLRRDALRAGRELLELGALQLVS